MYGWLGLPRLELAGSAVMVAVVTVAITQASEILGLPILTQMLSSTGAAMVRLGVALAYNATAWCWSLALIGGFLAHVPRRSAWLGSKSKRAPWPEKRLMDTEMMTSRSAAW